MLIPVVVLIGVVLIVIGLYLFIAEQYWFLVFGEKEENNNNSTDKDKDKILDLVNKLLNQTGKPPVNKTIIKFAPDICAYNPIYLDRLFPQLYCHAF